MWHGDAHWEDGLRDIIALPAQSLLLDDESGVIHQEFQSPTVIENRELMVLVISYDDHACLSHHPTSYWKHSDIFVEYASTANFDIFNQPP